jgi:hypothetical protein
MTLCLKLKNVEIFLISKQWLKMETYTKLMGDLSDYPHVQKRITLMWGHKECRTYLSTLLMDTRESESGVLRRGFKFSSAMAIEDLITEHDALFPQWVVERLDPWAV